ncbi:MAG: hypothetical protein KAI86_15185, partial [Desulfobacterales bacterium]|nr:hypothetical protein [Desulfobacterales bacterium]
KPPAMRVVVDPAWANPAASLPDSEFRRRIGEHPDSLRDATPHNPLYPGESVKIFIGKSILCLTSPTCQCSHIVAKI